MPPRDDHLPLTARQYEEEALRRYGAAIVAAIESLRRAEERFAESSAAVDAHIQRVLAAVADRSIGSRLQFRASGTSPQQSKGVAPDRTRIPSRTRSAPGAAAAVPSLAPAPSGVLP